MRPRPVTPCKGLSRWALGQSMYAVFALSRALQIESPQPPRVGDDRPRAHRHPGAGPDRTDEQAGKRIERAGRNGYSDEVVDEREEQILTDVAHRSAREPARAQQRAQVAFHQRDAGALDR